MELDNPKRWVGAYNPALAAASFGPSSGAIYLSTFSVSGIHHFRPTAFRFKFSWVGVGPAYRLTMLQALYKIKRGKGGTANTLEKICDIGNITRLAPTVGTTEYTNTATTTVTIQVLKEGLYAIGWLFRDTSLPGSLVIPTFYGATTPSYPGFFYFGDGGGATSLPAVINTFGVATNFTIYFDQT